MTTDAPPVAPASIPEPKPNPFARMVGALFSPNETFASIARKPDWVVPLVLLLIISAVFGMVMTTPGGFAAQAREAMERNKNATPGQAAHAVLFALLTNVEVFGIWTLVLFIIGFAHVARVSKAKSAAIVIPIRLVVALFGLIGPAFQALRK